MALKFGEESWDDDGTYRTRLTDVELFEVSPCTFPAYTSTSISARAKEDLEKARSRLKDAEKERHEQWREQMREKLKRKSL